MALADFSHSNTTITKLAFGSCHKNKYADATIWQRIADESPQVFLWTGDAVYPNIRDVAPLLLLREQYDQMKHNQSIGYAAFSASKRAEIFGTWDDHDYGGNDRGKEMTEKQERRDLFWDFLGYPPIERDGLYYSVTYQNDLQILFLDTRWHRDGHCLPSVAGKFPLGAGVACLTRWLSIGLDLKRYNICSSHKALLGEQQWKWLEQQLVQDFQVRIVVSSIQVLTTNPAMESWQHFREEQSRLVELLYRSGVDVILSGDVHHGEVLDTNLLEVTSSGLTHDCSKGIYGLLCWPLLELFHEHRTNKSNYYVGRNFGTIDIDYKQQTLQVNVHDVERGDVQLTTGPILFKVSSHNNSDLVLPTVDGHLVPLIAAAAIVLATVWYARRTRTRGSSTKTAH